MSRRTNRLLARAAAIATIAGTGPLFVGLTPAPASATPPTPHFTSAIEGDAPYQPQDSCISTAQPGVVKFRAMAIAAYPGTGDSGITRPCSDGGRSEHKEGRAFDWTASVTNAHQVAQVNDMLHWLFATDQYGNLHAMARRLGVMYIIWNARIWTAGSDHWDPYSCSGTTGCHKDHVHFSFSWAGALAKTSYWTGQVTTYVAPPIRVLDDAALPTSVTIPGNQASTIYTSFKLAAGHKYRLTASGVWSYGTRDGQPLLADAECTLHPSDNIWHRWTYWEGFPGHNSADLSASGNLVWMQGTTTNNGHGCSTDHVYTQDITMPGTSQLAFLVHDSDRSNNTGSLRVTISRR
ncbi:MAG: hypothetical protein ACJ735_01105 [Actinomycetes bacterium]